MGGELLDEDGENQAVRTFLMAYGEPGLTVARMRRHMELAGWPQAPEWTTKPEAQGHLTKGGAQDWLRHLFALERPAGQQLLDQAMTELRALTPEQLRAEFAKHKDSDIAVALRELNASQETLGVECGKVLYENLDALMDIAPTPEAQQQPQPR